VHTPKDARRAVRVNTKPVSGLTSRLNAFNPVRGAFPRICRADSQWLHHAAAGWGPWVNSITVAGAAPDSASKDASPASRSSGKMPFRIHLMSGHNRIGLSRCQEGHLSVPFEVAIVAGMNHTATRSPELEAALAAAAAAADISRDYYHGNFTVTTKEDLTPVTQADVECEQAIRKIILDAFPDDGFYGEETGRTQADAERLWLVDPIDGTKAFVRQYPFFSTQIALLQKGEIVLGVSSGTMLGELAWATKDQGAWLNDQPLSVSTIDDPSRAAYSTGNLKSLAKSDGWSRLAEFVAVSDRIRGYGDFYHYHLLAAGKIEAVIESDVNILDIAALSVIVTEAGGVFTDMNGGAVGLETRSVLAANPSLHAKLLDRLQGFVD
jgi:histidinol-phosphatase